MSEFSSFASTDSSSYDFASDPQGSVGGSAGSMAQMQTIIAQEQQRALIQQAISRCVVMNDDDEQWFFKPL